LNSNTQTVVLNKVAGYIDLEYKPTVNPGSQNVQGNQMPEQKYVPNIIITNMNLMPAATIGTFLLSLLSAACLAYQNQYRQHFLIDMSNPKSPESFGATGLQMQFEPAAVMATTGAAVTDQNRLMFMNKVLRNEEVLVSVQIPRCGENSAITDVIMAAAMGDQQAIMDVVKSLNMLNPNLQYNGNINDMFRQTGRTIWLGHYIDNNGEKRSLQDLSYLRVLNATGKNGLETTNDYVMSNRGSQNQDERMIRSIERNAILRAVLPGATVTGRADLLLINLELLRFLQLVATNCGINLNITNMGTNNFMQQNQYSDLADMAFNSSQIGGFTSGVSHGGYNFGSFANTGVNNRGWSL
jgi:hypothetical protein